MTMDDVRVRVAAGDGLVARFAGVLLVVPHITPQQEEHLQQLVHLCQEAAEARSTSRLPRRVAGLLAAADPEDVPSFALLALVDDEVTAVLVTGDVDVVVRGGGSDGQLLSGGDSPTWLDRLVRRPEGFQMRSSGTGPLAFPVHGDLQAGVVPGSAAEVVPAKGAESGTPLRSRAAAGAPPAAVGADRAAPAAVELGAPPAPGTARAEDPTMVVGRASEDRPELHADAAPGAGPDARPRGASAADVPAAGVSAAGGATSASPVAGLPPAPRTGEALVPSEGDAEDLRVGDSVDSGPAARPRGTGPDSASSERQQARPASTGARAEIVPLVGVGVEEERRPLPTAAPRDEPMALHEGRASVHVEGILCSLMHLNDPRGLFCNVCGRSLVHVTQARVEGPRPSLGVLVLDDATVYSLDADYVIGREPERDEGVAAGRLRPLRLDEEDAVASRVHAEIRLSGWDVLVEDRGSANGTYLAPPDTESWQPLTPRRPVALQPGSRLKVGERVLQFESRHYR